MYAKQKTKDPTICCDARVDLLVVARESGRLQLYSLPHGALLSVLDIAVEVLFYLVLTIYLLATKSFEIAMR